MENETCRNCAELNRCRDSRTSWIFFIIGLIATISIRVVTVLMHVNPIYAKIAWYIGVGGFFLFFVYKFRVSQQRSNIIIQKNLLSRIRGRQQLTEDDFNVVASLLCSLNSKKERINYIFIFALSAVALILALYFDLLR